MVHSIFSLSSSFISVSQKSYASISSSSLQLPCFGKLLTQISRLLFCNSNLMTSASSLFYCSTLWFNCVSNFPFTWSCSLTSVLKFQFLLADYLFYLYFYNLNHLFHFACHFCDTFSTFTISCFKSLILLLKSFPNSANNSAIFSPFPDSIFIL